MDKKSRRNPRRGSSGTTLKELMELPCLLATVWLKLKAMVDNVVMSFFESNFRGLLNTNIYSEEMWSEFAMKGITGMTPITSQQSRTKTLRLDEEFFLSLLTEELATTDHILRCGSAHTQNRQNKRLHTNALQYQGRRLQASRRNGNYPDDRDILHQAPKDMSRRREQCRLSQERYRKKQENYGKNVEQSVLKLRYEVPLLELQRTRALYAASPTVWSIASEYFQLFQHGVDISDDSLSRSTDCLQNPKTQRQLVFLRSVMADNIVLDRSLGADAVMEQWRLYSTYFDNLQLQLGSVNKKSAKVTWVSSTLSVTITKTTLEFVFPHLLSGETARKATRSSVSALSRVG
ncbi:unnamed protein product [Phytophthora lilii]|uniref:Unnamed protein product n=1 Tax=Phytophthora lilii TaxID=2077276 RepID=A0A9W6UE40_9STRA|nr:unnamed protein product [Phytophthora lilii]